jgi:hypothetical protein
MMREEAAPVLQTSTGLKPCCEKSDGMTGRLIR